jgi:hypothetical protein
MPVAEMRQRVSAREFMEWIAYLNEKARREREAAKRAQRRAKA